MKECFIKSLEIIFLHVSGQKCGGKKYKLLKSNKKKGLLSKVMFGLKVK